MPELKPCPFCGNTKLKVDSKSKRNSYTHTVHFMVSVRCLCCHARGGTASGEIPVHFGELKLDKLTDYSALKHEAIENWNRRAENE